MLFRSNDTAYEMNLCDWSSDVCSSDLGSLISGSSAFSKPSLNVWKFLVHIMLKPSMQDGASLVAHLVKNLPAMLETSL